jgi:hypothetical protein
MWINKQLALALSLSLFAACGGDDDGSDVEVTSNPASATSTVAQMNAFTTAFASGNGETAAFAAYSIGGSAASIVTPAAPDQARRTTGTFNAVGTCECTDSGCTFEGCGDDAGTWMIDGSIGKSGDTYTFDYTMDIGIAGQAWSWTTDSDITISDTAIEGDISADGEGSFDDGQGGTVDLSWSWSVTNNDIVLDETGCAVGGSMDASVDYEGTSGGQSGSYSGSATVTFGPACGQAE